MDALTSGQKFNIAHIAMMVLLLKLFSLFHIHHLRDDFGIPTIRTNYPFSFVLWWQMVEFLAVLTIILWFAPWLSNICTLYNHQLIQPVIIENSLFVADNTIWQAFVKCFYLKLIIFISFFFMIYRWLPQKGNGSNGILESWKFEKNLFVRICSKIEYLNSLKMYT